MPASNFYISSVLTIQGHKTTKIMNNNEYTKSINEFDFNLICEYFSSVTRQGPGSEEATLQALRFAEELDLHGKAADIGCGTGTPTLSLALNTRMSITAVDLFPRFIDILQQRIERASLSDRVKAIAADMSALPFDKASLDLIWSEGAIYNVGFRSGLRLWRPFLKPGAYVAVSEATWFTEQRPDEIEQFWHESYPEIDTIDAKIKVMQKEGYDVIAAFRLPEKCWTDNFYIPQQLSQKKFLKLHPNNATATALVANQCREAELYSRYHQYYGYVFYIGRKPMKRN